MAEYYGGREVDTSLCVGGKMPTARPTTRPLSARANRQACALQYNRALQQIVADQAASIEDARFQRQLVHLETQAGLQEQSESKARQIEVFKDRQRQSMAERSERYYAAEFCRSQDWESKKKAWWCANNREEKTEMRAWNSELNKRRNRQTERYETFIDHQRVMQSEVDAAQQRADILEDRREEQRSVNLKKLEQMEAFRYAEEQRLERQQMAELTKEMRRKEGRILQLMRDKLTWQAASCYREVAPQELIIKEKLEDEQRQLGGVYTQVQQRRRPKSANATTGRGGCPRTGGIPAFSELSSRDVMEAQALRREAVKHGPPVSVIDPRIGCV